MKLLANENVPLDMVEALRDVGIETQRRTAPNRGKGKFRQD